MIDLVDVPVPAILAAVFVIAVGLVLLTNQACRAAGYYFQKPAVYDARAIAQDLQTYYFAHPQAGPIPVPASVVEAAIRELRRQWAIADSCAQCRGRP